MSLRAMTRCCRAALVTALMIAPSACGDVAAITEDLTPEILSGVWEVTDLTISNPAVPGQFVDFVAEGGSFEFRFTLDGEVTFFVTNLDGETASETAEYEIAEPFLFFTFGDGEVDAYAYELQSTQTGNSLTFATDDEEYDFDGDGMPDPAFFAGVMIR